MQATETQCTFRNYHVTKVRTLSMENLTVRVFRSIEHLDKLRFQWEGLLAHYPQGSIFSTWESLTTWWRAFGADQQLHVLAFEDGSSQLVGLAPLSVTTRKIHSRKEL